MCNNYYLLSFFVLHQKGKNIKKKLLITVVVVCATIMTTIVSIMAATNACSHNDVRYKQISGPEEMHEVWCNDCGSFIVAELHTFHAETDAFRHWQECEDCGHKEDEELHSLISETDDLRHWQECEDCGYSTSKTRHTFGSVFGNAENGHVYICTGCNYRRTEAHIWGSDGICDVCGKQDTSGLGPEEIIIDPVTE